MQVRPYTPKFAAAAGRRARRWTATSSGGLNANPLSYPSGVIYDTTGQKFGSGAISGYYGISPSFTLTAPFTIEAFIKGGGVSGNYEIAIGNNATVGWFGANPAGHLVCYVGNGSGYALFDPGTAMPSSWTHCAMVVSGSSIANASLYVGGSAVSSTSSSGTSFSFGSGPIGVRDNGATSSPFPFYGEVDEVRISNVVRYSGSSLTVPTSAFTTDSNTRALWHLDGNGNDSA